VHHGRIEVNVFTIQSIKVGKRSGVFDLPGKSLSPRQAIFENKKFSDAGKK
jgi:hypothetical protein